jgi:NAD(P)-dependent dehydrogenase (short-subunit alcohol dehydrogenase family)
MKGKVALVMGGGAGTGRATSLAFAREGAAVVVADISEKAGREAVALIEQAGGTALFVGADMGNAADIRRVLETVASRFGGLHAVSNNAAAGTANTPLAEISEEAWDRCMAVTLRGVWLSMKHQLPLIEASGGGAIVNIASLSGIRGDAMQGAYAAAKAGVINLTKTAAVEYARRGVRVNCVCPGGIDSGGMRFYLKAMPEMREKTEAIHPMGRLARPEEIADAAVYLCSERASFITGHALVVDGGVMVRSNVIET